MPSYAEKFLTSEYFSNNSEDKLDRRYASSVIDTLSVMYAKGLIEPTDTGNQGANLEKYKDAANNQWLIRGLVQAITTYRITTKNRSQR